ncbi:MAG: BrnA antitoxin family protein [Aestuariivirgaceae bacterium]|nr:BrnA antitoxin family protein [Aestuariivirgaceae bacterium]
MDPDDAPKLTEEWFETADFYIGEKLIRRGRPVGSGTKQQITLRLDKDVIEAFRKTGPGWQARMNDVLARSAKRKKTG